MKFSITANKAVFGERPKEPKCEHCGRIRGHHKAITLHCPDGPRHRTMGYLSFSAVQVFKAKESL